MGKFAKRRQEKKSKPKGGILQKLRSGVSKIRGGSSASPTSARTSGGRRKGRANSPEYWAKKVIVAKLKKKYFKTKYGSV